MNASNAIEILLVEDDPNDVDMILRALRKKNLANYIEVAQDGADALDFIFCEGGHAGRDIDRVPRVILLDLKLPKVNGLEVLKRVKTNSCTKMIPVVVLTSSREQRDLVEAYGLGANSYVVKPVNFEDFVQMVQDVGTYWLLHNQR